MKIDFVFLLKAINDCQNIAISHPIDGETHQYLSRFFKVLSKEESIIIDYPFMDGYTHPKLTAGDPVFIYFQTAGFRFHFQSKVEEPFNFTLADGTRIPALKIAWPDTVRDGNRRSFYRITIHLDHSVKVKYKILGNINAESISFSGTDKVEYRGVEAVMVDLSENGIAVEIRRKINIDTGDLLKLSFQLDDGAQTDIEIEGIVRNFREFPGSDIHICGIEFTPEKTTRYKEALKKIIRYIMDHNRENISFFTVNKTISKNPFVQKIVENEATEDFINLLLLKKLPLTEEEYLESLVYVLKIGKFQAQARLVLESLPPAIKESYIQRPNANHRVAFYIVEEAISTPYPTLITEVINNQYLPEVFLYKIAETGSPRMLKALLAQKSKVMAFPEILEIMEDNPNVTPSVLEAIQRVREDYREKDETDTIPETEVTQNVGDFVAAAHKENIFPKEALKSREVQNETLRLLHRINKMNLQERIRLAFTGAKSERMILAKSPNKFIVQAVVAGPKITEDEILLIAKNPNTPKEAILKICENKHWMKNYPVIFSLLKHPNFPSKKAAGYIEKLQPEDIAALADDKHANALVRNLAKYYRQRA